MSRPPFKFHEALYVTAATILRCDKSPCAFPLNINGYNCACVTDVQPCQRNTYVLLSHDPNKIWLWYGLRWYFSGYTQVNMAHSIWVVFFFFFNECCLRSDGTATKCSASREGAHVVFLAFIYCIFCLCHRGASLEPFFSNYIQTFFRASPSKIHPLIKRLQTTCDFWSVRHMALPTYLNLFSNTWLALRMYKPFLC